MKSERMTILVTPEQKAAILARANGLGLSAGEMMRRAVESYDPAAAAASEDEVALNALADELFAAARSARAALGAATREVKATLKHLDKSRRVAHGRV